MKCCVPLCMLLLNTALPALYGQPSQLSVLLGSTVPMPAFGCCLQLIVFAVLFNVKLTHHVYKSVLHCGLYCACNFHLPLNLLLSCTTVSAVMSALGFACCYLLLAACCWLLFACCWLLTYLVLVNGCYLFLLLGTCYSAVFTVTAFCAVCLF